MLSDSNPFSKCTTKDEIVDCYLQQLNKIKKIAKQKYAIESNEFVELFGDEFVSAKFHPTPNFIAHSKRISKHETSKFPVHYFDACFIKYVYSQLKRFTSYMVFIAFVFVLVNYRVEFTKLFMRNIQVYIYPGMRFWRKITLPVIQQFPQFTAFYDETCLVSNPFFRVENLDCSPCADVINVVDLTITPNFGYFGNNIPHIIPQADGTNQSIAQIHRIYQQNRKLFRQEAYKIYSSDRNIANLDQLFDVMLNRSEKGERKPSHNLWRINRMTPARILRALFPTPKTIPMHAGIDIERYIAFDVNGGVTYQLPSTDCSNMFIYQAIGSRIIHLQPTMFYDWWYWKPISSPAHQRSKTTSVSYIGSYC